MTEVAGVLDPMLDARARLVAAHRDERVAPLDAVALRIRQAARGAESARSGMGVDLCLDFLRVALDDARSLTAAADAELHGS